jgi:hypothetical protein
MPNNAALLFNLNINRHIRIQPHNRNLRQNKWNVSYPAGQSLPLDSWVLQPDLIWRVV